MDGGNIGRSKRENQRERGAEERKENGGRKTEIIS